VAMETITGVTYIDVLKLCPDFVSLDISVSSTGWCKWSNGNFTYGKYSLLTPTEDDVGRRREFRDFLKDLFKDEEFEYLFVEDVIGGVNHKTNKILYQLNPLADDLIDDGVLKVKKVLREDNNKWKMHLRKCSGFVSSVRGSKDVKGDIQSCLHMLGFGSASTPLVEDIYDAVGLAMGLIFKLYVLKDTKTGPKLKKNISKVYKLKQFTEEYSALDYANDVGGSIESVNFCNIKKDLKWNFKRLIENLDDDKRTFVISIFTCKIGALALDKGFDLDSEMSYIVAYR
jgi:hypothetical protein